MRLYIHVQVHEPCTSTLVMALVPGLVVPHDILTGRGEIYIVDS